MNLKHRLLLALLIVWVNYGASVAPTYGSDLSEFLRAVFENHHQRAPTGAEINYYSNLSRNAGPLESYIAMVSSDDYFVNQCQRNTQVYVTRIYQLFLHRDPQPDELRFWVNQYQSGRMDRSSLVRQFCQTNNINAVPGARSVYRPSFRPPTDAVSCADALLTKVRLLNQVVTRGFGGTWFGQNLLNSTASLQATTSQFRDAVSSRNSTQQQIRIAADNLERALQQVESQFRAVPSASDQCRNLLWEISELVTAARSSQHGLAAPPVPRVTLAARGRTTARHAERLCIDDVGLSISITRLRQSQPRCKRFVCADSRSRRNGAHLAPTVRSESRYQQHQYAGPRHRPAVAASRFSPAARLVECSAPTGTSDRHCGRRWRFLCLVSTSRRDQPTKLESAARADQSRLPRVGSKPADRGRHGSIAIAHRQLHRFPATTGLAQS